MQVKFVKSTGKTGITTTFKTTFEYFGPSSDKYHKEIKLSEHMSFPIIDWATGAVFVLDKGDVFISNVEKQYQTSSGDKLFTSISVNHQDMQLPSWETAYCARHAKLFYIHKYKTVHEVQIVYDKSSGKVEAKTREFDFANVHVPKDYPMQFDGVSYAKMQKTGIVVDQVNCRVYIHDRRRFISFDPSRYRMEGEEIYPEEFYVLPDNFRVSGHNQVQIHENYMYIHVYDIKSKKKSIIRVSLTEPDRIYTEEDKFSSMSGRGLYNSRYKYRGSKRRYGSNRDKPSESNSSSEVGTPYQQVLLEQKKMNYMKIIQPEHNWDTHYCNNSCDEGRFCLAALEKLNDEADRWKFMWWEVQARGICVCGDQKLCSDSDANLNFKRYCGENRKSYVRNDFMNIKCKCKEGWTGKRCNVKVTETTSQASETESYAEPEITEKVTTNQNLLIKMKNFFINKF